MERREYVFVSVCLSSMFCKKKKTVFFFYENHAKQVSNYRHHHSTRRLHSEEGHQYEQSRGTIILIATAAPTSTATDNLKTL